MEQPFTKGTKKEGDPIPHRWLGEAFLRGLMDSIPAFVVSKAKENGKELSYHMGLDYIGSHKDFWRWEAGYRDLKNLLKDMNKYAMSLGKDYSPAKVLQYILDNSIIHHARLSEGINAADASDDMMEDFAALIDIASRYKTVKEFLEYIDMLIKEAEKARNGDQSKLVILNTVHGVKGQEREIVFCPGWAENVLPHARSIQDTPPTNSILPVTFKGRIEDERCVAFVAISRAKSILHITAPKMLFGKEMNVSRFVDDLGLNKKETAKVLFGEPTFEGFN